MIASVEMPILAEKGQKLTYLTEPKLPELT
jgi:hypothetical protein